MLRPGQGRGSATRAAVRRLAVARLLSMFGTDASGVAVGFALYAQTGSPAWLSLSLLLTIGASSVLAPIGGWLGDRLPRRAVMIGCELVAAALFLALALVHDPVALIVVGLLASAVGAAFGPAAGAAIAHVAGPSGLAWASGVIAASTNVGKMAGRFGGGLLIALGGPGLVFAVDALTFVVSAALIASVPLALGGGSVRDAAADEDVADGAADGEPDGEPDGGPDGEPSWRRGRPAIAGSFAFRDRQVRPVLLAACVSTFATSFSMTAEVPLVFELGGGAIGLGALTACWGLGMVAGSWYAARALHAGNEATGVLVGRVAMAIGIGSVSLAETLAPALLSYVIGGLGGGLMGVASQSLVLRRAPAAIRARVLGTIEACRNLSFGVGVSLAGVLVAPLGPSHTYALVGGAVLVGCLPLVSLVRELGGVRPLRPARAQVAGAEG